MLIIFTNKCSLKPLVTNALSPHNNSVKKSAHFQQMEPFPPPPKKKGEKKRKEEEPHMVLMK